MFRFAGVRVSPILGAGPAISKAAQARILSRPGQPRGFSSSLLSRSQTAQVPAKTTSATTIVSATLGAFLLSAGVATYMFVEKKRARAAVEALPIIPGNPIVYLDIEDNGMVIGRITIQLRADVVPRAAENFRALATGEKGYGYRTSRFHWIEKNSCVIGGDFIGTGDGGFSIYGPSFPDESYVLQHIGPGIVGMRNWGPDTNNSQFYITLSSQPRLDGISQVIGNVLEGWEVLEKMNAAGMGRGGFEATHSFRIRACGEVKGYTKKANDDEKALKDLLQGSVTGTEHPHHHHHHATHPPAKV